MSAIRSAGALVLALAFSASSGAATFTVDTTADSVDANPGDGVCADAKGACSLRAAIGETNALAGADVVELPAGTFALTIAGIGEDLSATGDLDISDDVTLEGDGADATRIDGNAEDRVIEMHAGGGRRAIGLKGLTVQNGALVNANASGGAGLRVGVGVHLRLDDVAIRDNRATQTFGAIAIDTQGCVEGAHVRILDNRDTAGTGSGTAVAAVRVYEDGETDTGACFTLEDSEISGNRADWAGAIEADFAPVTIRRSLISDNEARFAGALLLNVAADTLLENVTISGNRGDPGAILNDGGSHLTLVNSTVTLNSGGKLGANVGGIQDVHGGFGLTFLSNTIVYGNGPGFIADDCDRATSVGGGNIIGDGARCHFDATPWDELDVDPGLGPLADNGGFTRTHLPGAAAIDRAQPAACPPTDQRGVPRPLDGDDDLEPACDAGAVEMQRDGIFGNGFDA
ncbi:MAG TPA: right-handed parallel beta-helix repeat-containing protein [Rhodanobacteraceae bacterium]|nr:right-handed parallel beta-helix repeat-containing protein [Rhodanobacteraceae bacterium]